MEKNISKYIKSFGASRYRKKADDEAFWQNICLNFVIHRNAEFVIMPGKKVYFEIGCGCGDMLVDFALNNPDFICIGADVYQGGLIQTARKFSAINLQNILLFQGDGRELLERVQNGVIDIMAVLFPDPWPKRKHNYRRIISDANLSILLPKLKSNGKFICASDITDYQIQMENTLLKMEDGCVSAFDDYDVKKAPDLGFYEPTKYHQKAILAGRKSKFFVLQKK